MSERKIARIVLRLAEKTLNDEIDWEESSVDNNYVATFSGYSISISEEPGFDADSPDYVLNIRNEDGLVIESKTDVELKDYMSESFIKMKNLHQSARRKAMGVDDALDNILSQLDDDQDLF